MSTLSIRQDVHNASALLLMPAMPPPPGVKSDFNTPPSNYHLIAVLNGTFLGLAMAFLIIRVYTRRTLPKGHRTSWDDGCSIVALIASIVHTGLVYRALEIGYGRHIWNLPALTFTRDNLRLFASIDIVYNLAMFLVKLSILLLYRRLFSVYQTLNRFIIVGYAVITFIMVGTIANSIARLQVCTDVQKSLTEPFCSGIKVNISVLTSASLNTLADFCILAIPIRRVVKMKVATARKIGLLFIFISGLIACTMSVLRLAMMTKHMHSSDVLWNASRITPFTIIEMNLGIICSCMMFTPAFYHKGQDAARSLKSLLSSRSKSGSTSRVESLENLENSGKLERAGNSSDSGKAPWESNVPDLELLTEAHVKTSS